MFHVLDSITKKPELYSIYTAKELWTDPYISQQMLTAHLDPHSDKASRNHRFIESSTAFLAARFNLGEGKSVLDFGCGPGLYTSRFAKLGCKVTGLDFSQNSIDYAKKEAEKLGLEIEYYLVDYLEYRPTDKFDLVTMIFCDYCALSDQQRKKVLQIMKDCLKDDGHIFLDVCTDNFYRQIEEGTTLERVETKGFWSPHPYFEINSSFKYDEHRVSLDKYTIIGENRTFEIYNWLKHFTPEEISGEFEENGLDIVEMYPEFGSPAIGGNSEIMGIVGTKKPVGQQGKKSFL